MSRALTYQQATNCENATKPRCRCRCGGALHGAKRGKVTGLLFSDPHSPTRECPTCRGQDPSCARCRGQGKVYVRSVPIEEQYPDVWTGSTAMVEGNAPGELDDHKTD